MKNLNDIATAILVKYTNKKFTKAIVMDKIETTNTEYMLNMQKQLNMLLDWAAEHCYELGCEPSEVEIIYQGLDYDTKDALGVQMYITSHPEEWKRIMYFMHRKDLEQTQRVHDYCLLKQVLEVKVETLVKWNKSLMYLLGFIIVSNMLAVIVIKALGWI